MPEDEGPRVGRLNQTVGWDSRWEWDRIPMGDLSLLLFVSMGGSGTQF